MRKAMPSSSRRVAAAEPKVDSTPPHNEDCWIVGLGASAGGLEALELFLKHVPANNELSFIIVQHLDPTKKGMLVEILERATPMKVIEIQDQMGIEPNHVYVVRPGFDVSILNGVLHLLEPAEPRGLRLPIDFFFRSLAADMKGRCVGVILSGMGQDGTQGIRAIKKHGGGVFVQEPASAKFDSMPRSASNTGLADAIAPVEELPDKITAHLRRPSGSKSIPAKLPDQDQSSIEKVIVLLRAATGNDFSLYKKSTILRRVERRMGLHQLNSISDYVRYIRENPGEEQLLFKELLIGVTSFFRDPTVWDQLKTEVFPALLAAHPAGGMFRAWVSGCSTGEEPYSLAIVFKEAMEVEHPDKKYTLQIFATDLDKDAIDKSRQGFYPTNLSAHVSQDRLQRFFTATDHGYQISKEIRAMVIFAPQNATMDPPFTKLDLVSCRNLLIYFETELQHKLIQMFHYSLNPNGFLLLGSAETIGVATDLFTALPGKTRIYRRVDPQSSNTAALVPLLPSNRVTVETKDLIPLTKPQGITPDVATLTTDLLLQVYAPAAALVRENGDIEYISGRTKRYVETGAGTSNLNLFAMAREGLSGPLKRAFSRALRKKTTVVLRRLSMKIEGGKQAVDVTVQPLAEPEGLRGKVMVVITDAAAPSSVAVKGHKTGRAAGKDPRLTVMTQELRYAREEREQSREEAQAREEELKSINEELQSTNEEMQSTNEELSTSREEMQSMNEELQTVNQELQATVDDAVRARNDINNLLNSTEIAALFLDSALNVLQFTPPTAKLIKLIAVDVGRPITDLVTDLQYPDLAADCGEVLRALVGKTRQVSTRDQRWFAVRISPYQTQDKRIDGLVITFFDITRAKRLEATLDEAMTVLKDRFSGQVSERDKIKDLEAVLKNARSILEHGSTIETLVINPSAVR